MIGEGPFPAVGKEDADIINPGKETITINPGGCTFSSSESFAMVRGRHIAITVLGAMQVSSSGDLASWEIVRNSIKMILIGSTDI
jgi:3-oxoacid CoA-transferase subunit B